jgi:hypothetical protein
MARSRFYDEKLAAEPRDPTWARSVESRAKELYEAKEFEGTDLVNVSCYTKSCRLEFSYADMANRERHLSSLPRDFPDLPRASFAYPGAPADQLRAIVYLSKEKLERFSYDQYTKAE